MKHLTKSAARTLARLRSSIAAMEHRQKIDRATRALETEMRTICHLGERPPAGWSKAKVAAAADWSCRRGAALWNRVARLQRAAA
jgi:hypothetical protein